VGVVQPMNQRYIGGLVGARSGIDRGDRDEFLTLGVSGFDREDASHRQPLPVR
jgi:hypothetical protein